MAAPSAGQKALAAAHGGRDLRLGPPPRQPLPAADIATRKASTATPTSSAPRNRAQPAPRKALPDKARQDHARPTISAFGDSVMLGARTWLDRTFPGGTLDAIEGRQPDPILHDVEQDAAAGKLNPVVVIGVGDNGLIDPDALRHALVCLHDAAGVEHVVVVNNRVGRDWENLNNRTIAAVVPRFDN